MKYFPYRKPRERKEPRKFKIYNKNNKNDINVSVSVI